MATEASPLFGRYSDGIRASAHEVEIRRIAIGIEIGFPQTGAKLIWTFPEMRLEREGGEARLHRVREGVDAGERLTANLALFERDFADDARKFGTGAAGEPAMSNILIWAGLSVASLALIAFVGLPLLARVLAPLIPYSWEVSLGNSVEPQILEMVGQGKKAKLCDKAEGKAALAAMVSRLTAKIKLPGELKVDIVDLPVTNAFALPGGRIFLFRPVIEKASNPDEVAGVLAHEIGHVIHRDSMRGIIHDSALSVIIGVMLGDITGGGIIGGLGKAALGSAYSRENERDADEVSVKLMGDAGADPRAINNFFRRLSALEGGGGDGGLLAALSSHPVTRERIDTVEHLAEAAPAPQSPVLDRAEWAALKAICATAR